jgi:hypothetical protein
MEDKEVEKKCVKVMPIAANSIWLKILVRKSIGKGH